MQNSTHVKLVVFTRNPVMGKVKTRLQPVFSEGASLRIHKKMIHDTLAKVSRLKELDTELCCADGNTSSFLRDCKETYPVILGEQHGADLGERMFSSLQCALDTYDKVVIIGTDCPDLDGTYIRKAIKALDNTDVVIGPAEDGGYVLLGLKKISVELFSNIEWGTSTVLEKTLERIKKLKWSFTELDTLHDVDRAEDMYRYKELLTEVD